ncbi:MAG: hypothetical protein IAI50_02660 [Candidatus Eremiobacteraeota bacterium]|nr:hypothetical protein [Candidatus Eremiobacteraeota bacterium]
MAFVRLALIASLAVVQAASAFAVAAAAGTRVTVPDGTAVDIAPVTILGTMINPKGSTFEATVKKDVVVGGLVIVKAGAKAQGTVVDSIAGDNMRMMPQEQSGPGVKYTKGFLTIEGNDVKGPPLRIKFDWVQGVDGLKLRLGDVTTEGDSNGNPAQAAPGPDYLLQTVTKMKKRSIFSMNSTYDFNVKSGAGSIPPSQVFSARIKGPVHTVSSLKSGDPSNDGFAH